MVTGLEPEESQAIVAVSLGGSGHHLEMCFAVFGTSLVDIWEEEDRADGGALAVLVVYLLVD